MTEPPSCVFPPDKSTPAAHQIYIKITTVFSTCSFNMINRNYKSVQLVPLFEDEKNIHQFNIDNWF